MIVAKLSFNQRSFHHCIVTMLPNHWWLISCIIVIVEFIMAPCVKC